MKLSDLEIHLTQHHPGLRRSPNHKGTWHLGKSDKDELFLTIRDTGISSVSYYSNSDFKYSITFSADVPLFLLSQNLNFVIESISI